MHCIRDEGSTNKLMTAAEEKIGNSLTELFLEVGKPVELVA
jgi:hypothetical protein